MTVLNYGADSAVEVDFPPEVLVAACGPAREAALADPVAAVAAALAAPLDYPPLAAAVVPGDHVALVVADDLPQAAAVVAGTVTALMQSGIEPAQITVVQTRAAREAGAEDPCRALAADVREQVQFAIHDPEDRGNIALLGPTAQNEGIYLHRAICEADVVLPLGVYRLPHTLDYRGGYADVFPAFSDEATVARFRGVKFMTSSKERKQRRRETDEVGWRLGARLVVAVVPGAGDSAQQVLAGDVDAVLKAGSESAASVWQCELPRRASLVVATIEGGAAQQTWSNVARALSAARRAVAYEGAIALCTELATSPGEALMQLAHAEDLDAVVEALRDSHASDAAAAWEVARCLQRGTVFFLSRLPEELVESLGLAPIADPEQIGRLAQRFDSCIVLANAQYAAPRVAEDDEASE